MKPNITNSFISGLATAGMATQGETMLREIEALRKELVEKIVTITGLPIGEITVDISINSDNRSNLAAGAKALGWYPDRQAESAWYTSEVPQGGSTTVFVE